MIFITFQPNTLKKYTTWNQPEFQIKTWQQTQEKDILSWQVAMVQVLHLTSQEGHARLLKVYIKGKQTQT